jgi:polysaccharide pyruvyl transferase WcaK-like protein
MAVLGLAEEVRECIRAWRVLEGTDVFVIPGTGLLTDAFGLSGMGPYGLFKWSLTARLRGCKVLFVSVGAGPVDGRLGRVLLKCALSLAKYRSYRDVPSRDVVEGLGVRTSHDRIYPDLVFGLSTGLRTAGADRKRGPVVGLGLMEYFEAYSIANPMHDTYERYLESLAAFVGWLVDHEYRVKLLLGDADADPVVIGDLKTVLRERLAWNIDERVTDHSIDSVDELLAQLGECDYVVATRFHNVLMSLLVGKPVIAISFHHKCSSLMNDMGLSEYCQDINRMTADELIAAFERLAEHAQELEGMIAQRIEESRTALNEQYGALFESPIDPSRPVHKVTAAA